MKAKTYIHADTITKRLTAKDPERQDKIARIYAKAQELHVKLGKEDDDKERY